MKKLSRVVSFAMSALMVTSCFSGLSFTAAAVENDTTKIYFQVPELEAWGTTKSAYCHAYCVYGNGPLKETSWQSKSEKCTKESDGLYSFDLDAKVGTLVEGCDYAVLFSTVDTMGASHQTGNITMSSDCYGGTVYVTGNMIENTEDSTKLDYEAKWTDPELDQNYGPKAAITSTAKIVGSCFPVHQPKAQIVAQSIASWAVKNPTHYTQESVAALCEQLNVAPIDVYTQYTNDYATVAGTDNYASFEAVKELLQLNAPEPTTEPTEPETEPTTVPVTEPVTEPTTEPTAPTEPAEKTLVGCVVAGSSNVFGSEWDATDSANAMVKDGDVYTLTLSNVPAVESASFKIVAKYSDDSVEWIGDATGNNYMFRNTAEGNVTITFDPATGVAQYAGDNVKDISFEITAMYAVGNGDGAWLNGASWNPAAEENMMTETDTNVYEITYTGVEAYDNYEVKFAANGSWDNSWGLAENAAYVIGETVDAAYNGSNIKLAIGEEDDTNTYTVNMVIDLKDFNYATKTGGSIKISVEKEVEEPPYGQVIVAGSPEVLGTNWDGTDTNNAMTFENGVYTLAIADAPACDNFQFKLVLNSDTEPSWLGDGEFNFMVKISDSCDVTITFDPATGVVDIDGANVGPVDFTVDAMYAVGNGDGAWLNGASWNPAAEENKMTEISKGVYELVLTDVEAYDNYEVKFAANGTWDNSWGLAQDSVIVLGENVDAIYNGANIKLAIGSEDDGKLYTVTLRIDLNGFNFGDKTGAKMYVNYEEQGVEPKTLYGDVNKDGIIDVQDVTLLQEYIVCLANFDGIQTLVADVNADGYIDVTDVTTIQKYIVAYPASETALVGTEVLA